MLFQGSTCISVMYVSKSGHPRVPDSALPMQVRSERSGRSHIPQSRVHNLQLRAGTAKERKINIKKQQQQQKKNNGGSGSTLLDISTHWRRKWQPTPVFLPGESQGQRSLVGCRLWGRTESDAIEAT